MLYINATLELQEPQLDETADLVEHLQNEYEYNAKNPHDSNKLDVARFPEEALKLLVNVVDGDEEMADIVLRFVYDHIGIFYGYTGERQKASDQEHVTEGLYSVVAFIKNHNGHVDYSQLEDELIDYGKRDEDGISPDNVLEGLSGAKADTLFDLREEPDYQEYMDD